MATPSLSNFSFASRNSDASIVQPEKEQDALAAIVRERDIVAIIRLEPKVWRLLTRF